jgi:hypothetical protein
MFKEFRLDFKIRAAIGTLLLSAVIIEASLFGSGRILQVGPLTVKMILFCLALLYSAWSFLAGARLSNKVLLLVVSYTLLLCFGSLIGLLAGGEVDMIGGDIRQLSYLLILPFFEMSIPNVQRVWFAVRMIKIASVVMMAFYLAIGGLMLSGILSFGVISGWLNTVGNGDFMFDAAVGRVFYKGALYAGIAVILFFFDRGKWAKLGMVGAFITLVMTVTRGFILALFLVAILYLFMKRGKSVRRLVGIAILSIAGIVSLPAVFAMAGDKTASNSERIVTAQQVINRIDSVHTILGHGIGIGVPVRPEHMEMSYMEIFYKQGVLGLLWWGTLAFLMILDLRKAIHNGHESFGFALFLSAVFVALESLTNPFINNPIGMAAVLISFVGLSVLAKTPHSLAF